MIGLRPSQRALEIIFDWLQIDAKVPSWCSIRCWACRVGVAQLQQLSESTNGMIWMADHSNQIGQEKVLQIIGIPAQSCRLVGQTLSRDDMQAMAVIPVVELETRRCSPAVRETCIADWSTAVPAH